MQSAQQPDFSKLKHPWKWVAENHSWELKVPVEIQGRPGEWFIWFEQRPYYCDRGRYHCCVEGICVEGPDNAEGFPRYYFSLQRGMEEMEEWIAIRTEVVRKEQASTE